MRHVEICTGQLDVVRMESTPQTRQAAPVPDGFKAGKGKQPPPKENTPAKAEPVVDRRAQIARELGLTKLIPKFDQHEEPVLGKRTNLMAFGEVDQNRQTENEVREPSPKRPKTEPHQTANLKFYLRFKEGLEKKHRALLSHAPPLPESPNNQAKNDAAAETFVKAMMKLR